MLTPAVADVVSRDGISGGGEHAKCAACAKGMLTEPTAPSASSSAVGGFGEHGTSRVVAHPNASINCSPVAGRIDLRRSHGVGSNWSAIVSRGAIRRSFENSARSRSGQLHCRLR